MNKSIILRGESITPVNSTTYTDIVGLYAGLDRLPGETSDIFLKRVQRAVSLDRSSTYQGLLNQLNLQFGLEPAELFSITSGAAYTVRASLRGLFIDSAQESIFVPTRTVDKDNFWEWRTTADLVADINASRTFKATLQSDVPAVQIAWQSNRRQVRNVEVTGAIFVLPEQLVDQTSVLFNVAVPDFVFSENNQSILFDRAVSNGTLISYEHMLTPYSVIGYPATVLSLTDPDLESVALSPDGQMIYQLREYLYQVAKQDRSYWGN